MRALYFVRHGQSEDNKAGIWSRPTSALTDKGRLEALAAAQAIKSQGLTFDLIVVSSLPRAIETAQIICREIGHPFDLVEVNELFKERDFGTLTGTRGSDFYDGTRTPDDVNKVAGVEHIQDLQTRAKRGLEYLNAKPEPVILLVGHGTFGRSLRRVINGQPYHHEYLPDLVRYKNAELTRLL